MVKSVSGTYIRLSWSDAVEKFGRARRFDVSRKVGAVPHWNASNPNCPELCTNTYDDYQFGSKQLDFGGFKDWRLPSVEEWLSLIRKYYQYEERNRTSLLRNEIFNKHSSGYRSDSTEAPYWLANPSNRAADGKFLGSMSNLIGGEKCAWGCAWSSTSADWAITDKHTVRLVRAGSIFSLLH